MLKRCFVFGMCSMLLLGFMGIEAQAALGKKASRTTCGRCHFYGGG